MDDRQNLDHTLEDARRHGFSMLSLYELWHWNSCFPASVHHDPIMNMTRAVQDELKERFIELPVDADGVPIHVNDEMESKYHPDKVFIVKRLKYSEGHGWMIGGATREDLGEYHLYCCLNCHHYEPPTVEDEIRSIVQLCFNIKERGERWSVDDVMQSGNVSDVVAKLRLREEGE